MVGVHGVSSFWLDLSQESDVAADRRAAPDRNLGHPATEQRPDNSVGRLMMRPGPQL
jgi:hypothetical protein